MTKPTNILLGPSLRMVAGQHARERGLSLSGHMRELIRADDLASRAWQATSLPFSGSWAAGEHRQMSLNLFLLAVGRQHEQASAGRLGVFLPERKKPAG